MENNNNNKRIKLSGSLKSFDTSCVPCNVSCLSLKEVVFPGSLTAFNHFCELKELTVLVLGCNFEPSNDEQVHEQFYKKISFLLRACPLKVLDLRGSKMRPQALGSFLGTVCQQCKSLERVIVDQKLEEETLRKVNSKIEIGYHDGEGLVWEKGAKLDFATVAALVQSGGTIESIRKDIDDSPDKTIVRSAHVMEKPLKPWERKKQVMHQEQQQQQQQMNSNI